jgi:hypothetical protein
MSLCDGYMALRAKQQNQISNWDRSRLLLASFVRSKVTHLPSVLLLRTRQCVELAQQNSYAQFYPYRSSAKSVSTSILMSRAISERPWTHAGQVVANERGGEQTSNPQCNNGRA